MKRRIGMSKKRVVRLAGEERAGLQRLVGEGKRSGREDSPCPCAVAGGPYAPRSRMTRRPDMPGVAGSPPQGGGDLHTGSRADGDGAGQRYGTGNHAADAGCRCFVLSISAQRPEPACRPTVGWDAVAFAGGFCYYSRLVVGQHRSEIEGRI